MSLRIGIFDNAIACKYSPVHFEVWWYTKLSEGHVTFGPLFPKDQGFIEAIKDILVENPTTGGGLQRRRQRKILDTEEHKHLNGARWG